MKLIASSLGINPASAELKSIFGKHSNNSNLSGEGLDSTLSSGLLRNIDGNNESL